MQMPNVETSIKDERRNVTYRVLAYRPLTRAELVLSVRQFHAQLKIRRRGTPLTNQTITIVTVYGATDSI
jgi:hypothetical protein